MRRILMIMAFMLLPAFAMLGCDNDDFELETPAGEVKVDT